MTTVRTMSVLSAVAVFHECCARLDVNNIILVAVLVHFVT